MLRDKLQEVKGAVMICYPMGIPQWDAMRMILDGEDDGPAAVRSWKLCLEPAYKVGNVAAHERHAQHAMLQLTQILCLQYGTDDIAADGATLWFAGKQMIPENKLATHVGRHESTKAVVKLQKKGQGAPSRQPVLLSFVLELIMSERLQSLELHSCWIASRKSMAMNASMLQE